MAERLRFRVRPAQPEDAAAIARMIRALSEAEGGRSRMRAADVRAHGFGPRACFSLLLAEEASGRAAASASASSARARPRALGYALSSPFFDTDAGRPGAFLTDLFVDPAARCQGVGRALMAGLAAETRRSGGSFLVWTARADNIGALAFYRRIGAVGGVQTLHFLDGRPLSRLAARAVPKQ